MTAARLPVVTHGKSHLPLSLPQLQHTGPTAKASLLPVLRLLPPPSPLCTRERSCFRRVPTAPRSRRCSCGCHEPQGHQWLSGTPVVYEFSVAAIWNILSESCQHSPTSTGNSLKCRNCFIRKPRRRSCTEACVRNGSQPRTLHEAKSAAFTAYAELVANDKIIPKQETAVSRHATSTVQPMSWSAQRTSAPSEFVRCHRLPVGLNSRSSKFSCTRGGTPKAHELGSDTRGGS